MEQKKGCYKYGYVNKESREKDRTSERLYFFLLMSDKKYKEQDKLKGIEKRREIVGKV